MFGRDAFATIQSPARLTACLLALACFKASLIAIAPARSSIAAAVNPRRGQNKPAATQGREAGRESTAERKLLEELETAFNAFADHFEIDRVERELAAAFRAFG